MSRDRHHVRDRIWRHKLLYGCCLLFRNWHILSNLMTQWGREKFIRSLWCGETEKTFCGSSYTLNSCQLSYLTFSFIGEVNVIWETSGKLWNRWKADELSEFWSDGQKKRKIDNCSQKNKKRYWICQKSSCFDSYNVTCHMIWESPKWSIVYDGSTHERSYFKHD